MRMCSVENLPAVKRPHSFLQPLPRDSETGPPTWVFFRPAHPIYSSKKSLVPESRILVRSELGLYEFQPTNFIAVCESKCKPIIGWNCAHYMPSMLHLLKESLELSPIKVWSLQISLLKLSKAHTCRCTHTRMSYNWHLIFETSKHKIKQMLEHSTKRSQDGNISRISSGPLIPMQDGILKG